MDDSNGLAVKYLGTISVILAVGLVLCFLASLGYNTYITYSGNKTKIKDFRS